MQTHAATRPRGVVMVAIVALWTACRSSNDTELRAPLAVDIAGLSSHCLPVTGGWVLEDRDTAGAYSGTAVLSLGDGRTLLFRVDATLGDLHFPGPAARHQTRYELTSSAKGVPAIVLDGDAAVAWSRFPVARVVDDASVVGRGAARGSIHVDGKLDALDGVLQAELNGTLCLDGHSGVGRLARRTASANAFSEPLPAGPSAAVLARGPPSTTPP